MDRRSEMSAGGDRSTACRTAADVPVSSVIGCQRHRERRDRTGACAPFTIDETGWIAGRSMTGSVVASSVSRCSARGGVALAASSRSPWRSSRRTASAFSFGLHPSSACARSVDMSGTDAASVNQPGSTGTIRARQAAPTTGRATRTSGAPAALARPSTPAAARLNAPRTSESTARVMAVATSSAWTTWNGIGSRFTAATALSTGNSRRGTRLPMKRLRTWRADSRLKISAGRRRTTRQSGLCASSSVEGAFRHRLLP